VLDLTPSERKGVLLLLGLVALGAVADLLQREPVPAPEPVERALPSPVVSQPTGPGFVAPAHAIDLNSAGVAELDGLPGIGPVLAARIVAHRDAHGPFHGIEELLAVQGIGPRQLERIGPRVIALPPRARSADSMQIARPLER
jgi:competence protein ComEA